MSIRFLLTWLLTAALVPSVSAQSACTPSWMPTFGPEATVDDIVYTSLAFDDGSGPALYIGGQFQASGPQRLGGIARWTGAGFAPVGNGLSNGSTHSVRTLIQYPPTPGGALFAVGWFPTGGGVAVWNGASWSGLGSGLSFANPPIPGLLTLPMAVAVHDRGTGPEIFVVGSFTLAGGVPVSGFASWNGSAWSAVPPPPTNATSLASFDDGSGPALYAGANGVWRFSAGAWTAVSSNVVSVAQLLVLDPGTGPELFALGQFGAAAPGTRDVARWNGTSWVQLGSGFDFQNTLGAIDTGGGPRLVVQGSVGSNGRLRVFDGLAWQPFFGDLVLSSGGFASARTLRSFDDGSGSKLFVGGLFGRVSGVPAGNLARFDGANWYGGQPGLNGAVNALARHDDGSGVALYAGGEFTAIDGAPVAHIARWNGSSWSAVGGGIAAPVLTLETFDAGGGPQLYAGTNGIARWDGSTWSGLGTGIQGLSNTAAWALQEFDDGNGNALFVGGRFATAGGLASQGIAKWNGSAWSALGGIDGPIFPLVTALAVFDDGNGPALYAAGRFSTIGGVPADGIAKGNGSAWSALSPGTTSGLVFALAVYDDGSGPALYAGGNFGQIAGFAAQSIARWNGTAWSALDTSFTNTVRALRVFDDGTGPALFVAGFSLPNGAILAKWDGAWTTVVPGNLQGFNQGYSLAQFDDGVRNGLFFGGAFTMSPSGDSHLAVLACPSAASFSSSCFGDGTGTACPCGSISAGGNGCPSSTQPAGAHLAWSGTASVANANLALVGSGMPDAACLYFQGSTRIAGGAGVPFGDGLLCIGGALVRLGVVFNGAGSSTYPGAGAPSLAVQGAIPRLGGVTRYYQGWYRSALGFCSASPFNLTNALGVEWGL